MGVTRAWGNRGTAGRGFAALALIVAAGSGWAQAWPAKPVRVVVPFTPGSATDLVGRAVAERLAAQTGQPFIVENRTGAGGTIGTAAVASAAADGATLLVNSSGHTVNPHLYASLPYDTLRDLAGVSMLAALPNVLIASPSRGWRSVADLLAYARANPGKVNYASAGVGSATHMNAEKFRLGAGLDAVHVPFKGTPEAITETITGRLDFFFAPLASVLGPLKDGRAIALAVGTPRRAALLADVPTTLEAGVANSDYTLWVGLFAPAKTPPEVLARVSAETLRAVQAPEARERFAKLGAEPMPMQPAEFDAVVRAELAANGPLVKAAGLRPQ